MGQRTLLPQQTGAQDHRVEIAVEIERPLKAAAQIVGSTPRSLRLPASEVILWRRPVRNIAVASQCADSTRTW